MHLSRSVIQAKTLTGSHVGNVVCIPRIIMNTDADDKTIPIQIRPRQFPVRPVFAMTINKSQGQTFQEIAIYLSAPVFAHGQLYVALSRLGDPRKNMITHPPLPDQPPGLPMTLNVVYTEIFKQINAFDSVVMIDSGSDDASRTIIAEYAPSNWKVMESNQPEIFGARGMDAEVQRLLHNRAASPASGASP
jgi:ATP-dependent DNA helicase PIF1